jgi:hypothetical protein
MLDTQILKTLQVSTACYGDSFSVYLNLVHSGPSVVVVFRKSKVKLSP